MNVTRKGQKTGLLSLKNYSEFIKVGPSRYNTGEITKNAVYLHIVWKNDIYVFHTFKVNSNKVDNEIIPFSQYEIEKQPK